MPGEYPTATMKLIDLGDRLNAYARVATRCPMLFKRRTVTRTYYEVLSMKLKVIIHEAEEGGYWAEVPAVAGCVSQGDTMEELLDNIHEAVEGCLSIDLEDIKISSNDQVMEIAV